MNFEAMMLSEISQMWKDKCCEITLTWGIQRSQMHSAGKDMVGKGLGEGEEERLLGTECQFGRM